MKRFRRSLPLRAVCAGLPAALLLGAAAALAAPQSAPPPGYDTSRGLAAAFLSGRHAEAVADSSTAADYFSRALSIDPDNPTLLRQAYFLLAQAGDIDAAIPAAKRSGELVPGRSLAPLIVAMGHYRQKEFDQAWSYIDKISQQGALGSMLPLMRAWAAAPVKTPEAAIAELTVLQASPGTATLYNLMAALLNEQAGRKTEALKYYDALAAEADSLSLPNLGVVAGGYHRLGRGDAVPGLLDKFRKAQGTSPVTEPYLARFAQARALPRAVTPAMGMAEALLIGAQIVVQSNARTPFYSQFSLVLSQLALYLNPDLVAARRIIGVTLAALGRFEGSNNILRSVERSDPDFLAVQFQLAGNLERMGDSEGAIAILQDIAAEHSGWAEVLVALGDIYRRDEQFAAAAEAYDRAEALLPPGDVSNWSFYYSRGVALERSKAWTRAEQDFKKALELNPDDPGVLNYLGYSWLDRGENLAEARALIEKAFQRRPEDGAIIDSLGWAMYKAGEYDNAVIHLEKAVEASPADPVINDHLGDVYWKVGRFKEARFQWERALLFETDDMQMRRAVQAKIEQGLAQN